MTMPIIRVPLLAGLILTFAPATASAFGSYRNNVPNGFSTPSGSASSCQNCHVNTGGGSP